MNYDWDGKAATKSRFYGIAGTVLLLLLLGLFVWSR